MDAPLFFLIMLAFLSAGSIVTRKIWRLNFTGPIEAFVFASALGSVITSTFITGLAFIGQVSPSTCWAVLAILLASGSGSLRGSRQWNFKTGFIFLSSSPLKISIQVILAALVLLSLSLALAPAFATDALVYHLAVPKAYLEAGGIINLPNNIYSFFPQQMEMLYLFALGLGSDSLAQLTGLGIVFLLLLALWQYYSQKGSTIYAWLVPLIFISTPTFFSVASSAYVDLQTATFIFLSFYAWDNWRERKQTGWFYLMTIFVGAALATKLTAIIALPVALLGVALQGKDNPEKVLSQCLILAFGALLFIMPWLARNYFFTGNPLAPFFMNLFGGENGMNWDFARSQQQFQYYSAFGMGHGILDFLLLPINLTFFSEPYSLKFDGRIGVVYLLLLPALFCLNRKSLPMVTVFLILLVFWFTQTQYIRLLTPAFAFLSVLLVLGLEQGMQKHGASVGKKEKIFLSFILAFGLLFNISIILKEWLRIEPLSYILNKESRIQFLSRQIKVYPFYWAANRAVGNQEKVLLVYMRNFGYLMNRPFHSDTFFEAHTLRKIIDEEVYAEAIIERLKSMGITHVLFNNNFVFGENSALTVGEKAIFKNFLARHARRIMAKNEFFLYRFMLDLEPGNPNKTSGLISIPLNH